MDSLNRYPSQNYAPSAPSLPQNYGQEPNPPPRFTSHNPNYPQPPQAASSPYGYGYGYSSSPAPPSYPQPQAASSPYGYGYGYGYGGGVFPPGTHPEIIRSFQMVDKDRSGFIDETELQEALSYGYHKFSLRTIKLLMFLFANPTNSLNIGPREFSALWRCIGEWRGIFERFDRDRSGKIDTVELRDALYSLGYAVPPSVLQVLISKYEDGSGRRGELNFDSFVECGMIVKGLTEKFKEKDPRYTGSATLNYETFMSTVIPFIVP